MDLRPTARELSWFAQIDRHGPQSSEFLFEATSETHRCKDTALRRMQALREAGYLRLPPQQRQIAKADFNPYVYDLTKLGWDFLSDHKDLEKHCRPTGHWWHGYWVSAVSSAVEINSNRAGLTYIPAAQILAIKGVEIAIPVSDTKLIPDQLFAIKYSDGYRAFVLEVDRGTEPFQSSAARKSLVRSIATYRRMLGEKAYQSHYGLKSKMGVLWIFSSTRRHQHFKNLLSSSDRSFKTEVLEIRFPVYSELSRSMRKLALMHQY